MIVTVLLLLNVGFSLGGQCANKYNSIKVAALGKIGYQLLLIVNVVVACVFFLISSGFYIEFCTATVLFACVYAAVVVLSIVSQTAALQLMEANNVSVINSSFSLIITVAMGFLLFKESVEPVKSIRLGLMVVAFLVVLQNNRKKQRITLRLLLAISGCVVVTVGNFLVLKLYSQFPDGDDSSFFFITNLLLLVVMSGHTLMTGRSRKAELRESLHAFKPSLLLAFMLPTICSNVNSILNMQLISRVEMTVLTPLFSAAGIFVGLVTSWIYKERVSKWSYLSAALATVAVII